MSNIQSTTLDELNSAISISPYLNEIDLSKLRKKPIDSRPLYICIDGMWNEEFLNKVAEESIHFDDWSGEKDFYGSRKKRWQSDIDKLPSFTKTFLAYLNQSTFLRVVEFLTDQEGLIPDPHFEGGGLHSTGEGGFLKMHIDFNYNENLRLHRRVNVLVYLNKNWAKEYGGNFELATKDCKGNFKTLLSLEPIFNRTVIFITDDSSYHGQPNPVMHPHKKRRNSIAAYYYLSDSNSKIKRTSTNYFDNSGKPIKEKVLKKILSKLKKSILH